MKNNECIVIAIAGASASGKSLLASTIFAELKNELGSDNIAIIAEDSYYRDQSHLTLQEREQINYDHPNSLDHELLVKHLDELNKGNCIEIPQYDYAIHNRKKETLKQAPKKIIILEGILLLTDEKIRERCNVSIFVDAPLDICFIRRLKRDLIERKRSVASVTTQYLNTVRPMFLQFIQPSKQYADIIVPRGGKNRVAINILKAQIKQLLGNNNASE